MKEIWKPYKTNNHLYAVSCFGRVFSFTSSRYLRASTCPKGYIQYGSVLGSAHRLVVKTFLGTIPDGYQVNHIDGDKSNNFIGNLEVLTPKENSQHAVRTGLSKPMSGPRNGMSKLQEDDVLDMYEMFRCGRSNAEVATVHGVDSGYVSLIRHGKRWKYLYEKLGTKFPKSHTFSTNKDLIILSHNLILNGWSNKHISEVTGVEVSMISRIRHGRCYKDFIESYTGILATTIP